MGPIWRVGLSMLMMFQAESRETEFKRPSVGKIMNDWMNKLQDSVLPLPPDLIQNVTRRTTELCLPTLIGPGKCRTHSKHTVERLLQSDVWALSKSGTKPPGVLMFEWLAGVQQELVPFPEGVPQFLAFRSSKLLLPVYAYPSQCKTDSEQTLHKVLKAESWALSMLDSSSRLRFGPGLMDGRIQDLGNYDQCLRVRDPEGQFVGQQCLVEVRGILPKQVNEFYGAFAVNGSSSGNFLMFSLCVPSSCEEGDIRVHVNRTLELAKITSATSINVFCSNSYSTPFRTKDWFALSVFALILLLVLISTFYEWRASGKKSELLSSFSIISNWRELTNNQTPPDIACLDGLRIICCSAVVVTHRFLLYVFMPFFNFQTFIEQRNSVLFALLGNGSMATEAFFVISGITRTYSFLRQRHNGKTLHHGYQSIQRYFRLTPVLAVMVLYTTTVSIHMADGPLWTKCAGFDQELCNHLWFLNLLHLTTVLLVKCRVESWFLASDFQLFLVSPLLLRPLFTRPKLGLFLLAACFSISTLLKMASSYAFLLFPDLVTLEGQKPLRDFSMSHSNTVYRMGAFVMGVALGYLLYEIKHDKRTFTLSKRTVWLGWALTLVVFLTTPVLHHTYFRHDYEDDPWMSVLYVGLWERVFMGGFCWIVLACTTGHGGWVNRVLSSPLLRPFARLTFGIYMSHVSIQMLHMFRTRQPLDYVTIDTLYLGIADVVAATGAATVLYLAVEMPFYRLACYLLKDKLVVSPEQKKSQQKEKKKKN